MVDLDTATLRNIGRAITERVGQSFAQQVGEPLESLQDLERVATFLAADDTEQVHMMIGQAVVEITGAWLPPPRVIDNPDELDTLPVDAVVVPVRSRTAWQNCDIPPCWDAVGAGYVLSSAELLEKQGPVVVAWLPPADDSPEGALEEGQ